jgi:5'-3' exonuclease
LDAILRLTQPRKSIMLAIDGPAPLAKLVTQRSRRKVRPTSAPEARSLHGGDSKLLLLLQHNSPPDASAAFSLAAAISRCEQKTFSSEERRKDTQGDAAAAAASKGSKAERKGRRRADKVVSSTALTPGTPFMHDVCVSCSYYICARLSQQRWQNVRTTAEHHVMYAE